MNEIVPHQIVPHQENLIGRAPDEIVAMVYQISAAEAAERRIQRGLPEIFANRATIRAAKIAVMLLLGLTPSTISETLKIHVTSVYTARKKLVKAGINLPELQRSRIDFSSLAAMFGGGR